MKLIKQIENLPLEDYLALEAEMVKSVQQPTLFTWVVAPTVIYGRHQNREQEVNEAYCAAHGVRVVQRQSGGGCVYADRGNLMVSYLSPSTRSQEVFDTFLRLLAGALRQLGYDAVTTSHNDVLVADRKVAGTACYTTPTGTVVHASVLYDVNLDALEQAITPSSAKLAKHAVASVRQRVCNLRSLCDLGDINTFRRLIETNMTNHQSQITNHQSPIAIFDLDGTLLNTIDDLGYACNHALAACGYPTHPIEAYPRLVGNGVRKLVERALNAGGVEPLPERIDVVMAEFVPYYNAHNCDYTRPYEGIPELLMELKARGFRLAVASNKYQAATEKIVAHFFPDVFDVVLGEREGVPRKPDPQIVRDIERSLTGGAGLSAKRFVSEAVCQSEGRSIYLGDSLVDRDTAANAGLPFVACSWGFVPRETLAEAGCPHIIDAPHELLPYCEN